MCGIVGAVAERNVVEIKLGSDQVQDFYVTSLSSRTVVYKGMVRSGVLARYYADLRAALKLS